MLQATLLVIWVEQHLQLQMQVAHPPLMDGASGPPLPSFTQGLQDDSHTAAADAAESSSAATPSHPWGHIASDFVAANSAHPPQDPPEDPQIAAPMDVPAPGTPVDESALENDVDEIFRQLINDAASEMGPRVQPAPLQPAANVDIVDGLLRQTMEEPIGEMGPQVQPAPLQPSANANQPTRAVFDRLAPRTLRHMASQEPSDVEPAPNASSDTTFSAAAFVLYALTLGQASMQPSSEAAAAQMVVM